MGDRVLADSTTLEQCSAGSVDVAHSPGGTRLATASSNCSSIDGNGNGGVVAVYEGGSGSPLWSLSGRFSLPRGARPTKLAWSHPEFGQALAVAADDGTVSVWVEEGGPRVVETGGGEGGGNGNKTKLWQRAATFESGSRGAALALAFAPAVHGPRLAVGWGDGVVRVYSARSLLLGCAGTTTTATATAALPLPAAASWELESQFEASRPPASSPVTSLCWRPHYAGGAGEKLPPLLAVGTAARRQQERRSGGVFGVGGGNENNGIEGGGGSSVWLFRTPLLRWTRACTLDPSGDVSAVAWAPAGSPAAPERVATAIKDKVRVFALAGAADALVSSSSPSSSSSSSSAPVLPEAVLKHSAPIWRLEWAPLGGGWLAAGTERGTVALWRQDLRGEWGARGAVVCDEAAAASSPSTASMAQQQDAASGLSTVVV